MSDQKKAAKILSHNDLYEENGEIRRTDNITPTHAPIFRPSSKKATQMNKNYGSFANLGSEQPSRAKTPET